MRTATANAGLVREMRSLRAYPATKSDAVWLDTAIHRTAADLITGVIDLDQRVRFADAEHEDRLREELRRVVLHTEPNDLPPGSPRAMWCAVRSLFSRGRRLTFEAIEAQARDWEPREVVARRLAEYREFGLGIGYHARPAARRLVVSRRALEAIEEHYSAIAGLYEDFRAAFRGVAVYQ